MQTETGAQSNAEPAPPKEHANCPTDQSPVGSRPPTRAELEVFISNLEKTVQGIEWELGKLRKLQSGGEGEIASLKFQVSALTHRLDPVEAQLRAIKRASVPTEGPSPVPADPEDPTEAEARRIILDQLHKNEYWGGRHTSGEHFCRGYLAKVSRSWILGGVVRRLVKDGLLLAHGKSADEHYSLNRAKANEIYEELGISPRDTRTESLGGKGEGPHESISGRNGKKPEAVSKGTFIHTVDTFRERIESVEAGLSAHAGHRLVLLQ